MKLEEALRKIRPADRRSMEEARARWRTVGKPLFSLGRLEDAVIRMAGIKGTSSYTLEKKVLVILCADNGVVEEGVTQTGQEVTAIVTENFTKKAASVCFMSEVAGVDLFPVDIGVARDVDHVTRPEYKAAYGTKNMTRGPAMSREEAERAILTGIRLVQELAEKGYDIIATGEMGIGNTTTSSAVVSVLLGRDPEEVTGRGAGLTTEGLRRKVEAIRRAVRLNAPDPADPIDVLAKVGGFEIGGIAGLILGAAAYRRPVLVDGFISTAGALIAQRLSPASAEYMILAHSSAERGHLRMRELLGKSPLLDLGLRLGEGTGAALAMPLLDAARAVMTQMSTFESAGVTEEGL